MQPSQFDRLTVRLGMRLSRRRALAAGVTGAAALSVAGRNVSTLAQDSTPAASDSSGDSPGFIYVQLADRGSWTPKPGDDGLFELTLYETGEQTLYFATGGEHIVGTMPTDEFLETLGFTPDNPPNAAVEVWTAAGERDVLVVQLIDPVYTSDSGDDTEATLTYDARVLSTYSGTRLSEWLPDVEDDQLPLEFTNVSLFIDSGCVVLSTCNRNDESGARQRIGPYPQGRVRQFPDDSGQCSPCCGGTIQLLIDNCNNSYPECQGGCYPL